MAKEAYSLAVSGGVGWSVVFLGRRRGGTVGGGGGGGAGGVDVGVGVGCRCSGSPGCVLFWLLLLLPLLLFLLLLPPLLVLLLLLPLLLPGRRRPLLFPLLLPLPLIAAAVAAVTSYLGWPTAFVRSFVFFFFFLQGVQEIQRDMMKFGSVTASFSVYSDFLTYSGGVYKNIAGDYTPH